VVLRGTSFKEEASAIMSETSLLYLPACSYIKRANGQNVYLHDTEPTSLLLCI